MPLRPPPVGRRAIPRTLALLALAALPAACSEERAALPPLEMPLPTAETLPHRVNQDCGCVRDGECAVLDERLGSLEVRGLGCRWLRPNQVALCRFEERFVPLYPDAQGNFVAVPEEWQARTLRAVLLPSGIWCAG